MSAELMLNMRGRIEQCRRLARLINDVQAAKALLQMAEEVEADLKKLQAANSEPKMQLPPQS